MKSFKNLTGELTVAIKNIYHRQELGGENRLMYVNPIVIKHYDFEFDAALKKDGKSIFEGLVNYEQSNSAIPFTINNIDQIDRNSIISLLLFYKENVVSSTRRTHILKYIEINTRLLQILQDEYDLK